MTEHFDEIIQQANLSQEQVEKYNKKSEDMRKLTQIEKKLQNGEEPTIEELRFLYAIDDKIEGFGYLKDPRIEELQKKRNIKKDLAKIFKLSRRPN